VRSRRVFRSDALHRLTPADLARLRGELGVRTLIDLRSSHELSSEGCAAFAQPPLAYHHLPFFDGPARDPARPRPEGGLSAIYLALLHFAKAPIARALETLAASPGAAVFYCAAGKDRTGVLSAVVLGSVGVVDADIVEDYADTRRALPRILERLRASEAYDYVFTELPPDTLHAEPATMQALLDLVRAEWGSMRDYASDAGTSPAALDDLAAGLLE